MTPKYTKESKYFSKINLYNYQFEFREKYFSDMALIVLVDKLSQVIENRKIVLVVFLYFSKAFDTINQIIL